MRPMFSGSTLDSFIKDMQNACTQLASVATRCPVLSQEPEDRPALSAFIPTQSGAGYLIAVHNADTTPLEIRQKARELHLLIQRHHSTEFRV